MANLLDALVRIDVQTFLKYFSRIKPFRYQFTLAKPWHTTVVSYSELKKDFVSKNTESGMYSALFDCGGDDVFRKYADATRGEEWTRIGKSKFVHPHEGLSKRVFVIWRKEQGRWVVDAIGDPSE